jgi:uncharacterized membrane protein/protein-disulfide isomerase
MIAASVLTIRHFFLANYPATIYQGSFCDINAFFNCDSSAFSPISQIWGVPLGYFGLVLGLLVALGAVFPSPSLERTNASLSLLNVLGVIALFAYSVFVLHDLCLLCSGYYLFSILSFILFASSALGRGLTRFLRPSLKLLAVLAVLTLAGAYGFVQYHQVMNEARGGTGQQIVKQYFELPPVKPPSLISPFWTARATDRFDAAPIQVIEYADFLCSDCLVLNQQLDQLKKEFEGKINIAFQFFPLEARCNKVVDKDFHPGACDLAFLAAHDPSKFLTIHDEIFANFNYARDPAWRLNLARRYGLEEAFRDPLTQDLVRRIIDTRAEYEKTSNPSAYGIHSTPAMIINNRLVIGTLPIQDLRAIFQALVEEREAGDRKFLEIRIPQPKGK